MAAKDKNGNDIKVGDQVIIRATVHHVTTTKVHNNIAVVTDEEMVPGHKTSIALGSKQVELVESTPPDSPAPVPSAATSDSPASPPPVASQTDDMHDAA